MSYFLFIINTGCPMRSCWK